MNISDVKAESASLSSVSGSISVRNAELTRRADAHTTSGDIDLDDISAAGIETDTTSGDLELDEVDTQSLTFTSTSGSISGELLHADEFGGTVTTVSGDISGIRSGSRGYTDIQDRNRQRRHRPRRLSKAMQNFPAERPHGRAGRRRKKETPPKTGKVLSSGLLRVWDAAVLPEEPGRFAPEVR